jgi:2-polyprenyl-6-methoxyphenol hydroxylase-like FAD-dependent oxidoreductase
MPDRKHALVIGASVSGLLAARVLSEFFERVTILDRDSLPGKAEVRKGTPQSNQIHVLLAGGANAIESLFPGFFLRLGHAGSVPVDFSTDEARWFQHGVWKQRACRRLIVHCQTRPLLEHAIRAEVAQLPNVSIRENVAVLRLGFSEDGSRVIGAHARNGSGGSDGELIAVDLVVDASGRNSAAAKWLEAAGYPAPAETSVNVRIGYASRIYQSPPGALPPWKALAVYAKAPVSTKSGVIFRVEGDRWIVTLMGCLGDYPAVDEAGFLDFASKLDDPAVHTWLQKAIPLTDAAPYRYPSHLRRRYERLTRFPENFLVLGDAFCSFNPIYGQGMTACAMEALALRDCLEREGGAGSLWRDFFKSAAEIVEGPWTIATGSDFMHPRVEGERAAGAKFRNWYFARLLQACGRDAEVTASLYEVLHLLKKPGVLFRPGIVGRVLARGGQP